MCCSVIHWRSSCTTHISADVFWWMKITCKASDTAENLQLYTVVWFLHLRSSCTTKHISMDIQRMTSNALYLTISGGRTKCVRWKNRTTRYILPRHWLYSDFLSFIVVELARFFNGGLQLQLHKIVKIRLDTEQWAIHGFHFQSL